MYNYHIIVDGKLIIEDNFCRSKDSLESCLSAFLLHYPLVETGRKIKIIITREK